MFNKKEETAEKPKVFRYRCKTKCTYKGKLVQEGEIIFLDKEEQLSHFELVKDKESEE
ncbi:MAG: hypothetical protein LBU88_00310 [Treponema sp.]|jgi:hypothetical protein|nr:hypothetical protein [Treponema sp.]